MHPFSFVSKLFFSGFLSWKGSFVRGQNNLKIATVWLISMQKRKKNDLLVIRLFIPASVTIPWQKNLSYKALSG